MMGWPHIALGIGFRAKDWSISCCGCWAACVSRRRAFAIINPLLASVVLTRSGRGLIASGRCACSLLGFSIAGRQQPGGDRDPGIITRLVARASSSSCTWPTDSLFVLGLLGSPIYLNVHVHRWTSLLLRLARNVNRSLT